MLSYENRDAVLKRNNRLCEVFKTFTEYVGLYNLRAEKEVPEFVSALANHQEFEARVNEWLDGAPQDKPSVSGLTYPLHSSESQGESRVKSSPRQDT